MNRDRARSLPRLTATILVALLGLAFAAGITYAASRLVSQPIGLSSEPQRIGNALAPPSDDQPADGSGRSGTPKRSSAPRAGRPGGPATTPATSQSPPPPSAADDGDGDSDD